MTCGQTRNQTPIYLPTNLFLIPQDVRQASESELPGLSYLVARALTIRSSTVGLSLWFTYIFGLCLGSQNHEMVSRESSDVGYELLHTGVTSGERIYIDCLLMLCQATL